jgi:hypothetical protein
MNTVKSNHHVNVLKYITATISLMIMVSCGEDASFNFNNASSNQGANESFNVCSNPDNISCHHLKAHETFIEDSFERENILPSEATTTEGFGWRKIINDNGRVVSGTASDNVDLKIFDDITFGPAGHLNRALYFYGRQGSSVHNLYLISKTFNLTNLEHVVMEFKYLPIALEANEHVKLEVCNDTLEACGVAGDVTVAGLNSTAWKPLFEMPASESNQTLNGKNHSVEDWKNMKVDVFLENFQKPNFVFRFNVRMDEGFKDNTVSKGLVDGLGLDKVRCTAYGYTDDADYIQIRKEIYQQK